MLNRFRENLTEYRRVFTITHKPSMEEFKGIIKISGIGIAVIGVLGFIVHVAWNLLN